MTSGSNSIAMDDANIGVRPASQTPKRGTEAHRGVSRNASRSISEIIGAIARVRWPIATASELAIRAKRTQRQAEEWLAGGGIGADALSNLIASEIGLEIIAEIVGEKNPTVQWFGDFRRAVTRAELRRKARELTKLIEANEDE